MNIWEWTLHLDYTPNAPGGHILDSQTLKAGLHHRNKGYQNKTKDCHKQMNVKGTTKMVCQLHINQFRAQFLFKNVPINAPRFWPHNCGSPLPSWTQKTIVSPKKAGRTETRASFPGPFLSPENGHVFGANTSIIHYKAVIQDNSMPGYNCSHLKTWDSWKCKPWAIHV